MANMRTALKRELTHVRTAVRQEIANNAASGGRFAAGLAGEGYAGGYLHAIDDILLTLDKILPSSSRYRAAWEEALKARKP